MTTDQARAVASGNIDLGDDTFKKTLERRYREDPEHKYLIWEGGHLTIGELHLASDRLANELLRLGVEHGDIVALMLDPHADHFIVHFALTKIGAIRTAINVNAKGDYLTLLLSDAKPKAIVAEPEYGDVLKSALDATPCDIEIWNDDGDAGLKALIAKGAQTTPPVDVSPDDPLALNYTSGTTGAPKKFSRSDRVLRIGCLGCILIGEWQSGDVLLLWEPLYHGAGNQTALAASMMKVTLALMPRFSASQFWEFARRYQATKIHYIGGILPILLKQPPSPLDKQHKVKIAWGAGSPADVSVEFKARFGVEVHEGYGLSEVANFVCINPDGPLGSVGRPLPFFDVRIVDDEGNDLPTGTAGQIVVKGKRPGLTSVSHNKVKTTTADGWIQTGDLGRFDENGYLFFAGRKSDSLRRRGENVSAWEVERIVGRNDDIEECALIGVPSGLGDDDLKLFVKLKPGASMAPLDLIRWCEDKMPYFQIPRYISIVDALPKTPTERVKKGDLSRSTGDCWDLEKSGYKLRR